MCRASLLVLQWLLALSATGDKHIHEQVQAQSPPALAMCLASSLVLQWL
jgi:hypothetical protein